MLKAVTFDLWRTLIGETPEGLLNSRSGRIRGIAAALLENKVVLTPEAISRAYDEAGKRLDALWAELRDIGPREQVEMLLEILQIEQHIRQSGFLMDRLVEAYTLPILSHLPVPLAGVPDVLAMLRARNLKMAVICNTGRTPGRVLRIILEQLNLAEYFPVQTYSDEIGLRKPHPAIFERTLAVLGVKPREALHVGDTASSDIAGARAVGMRAVHLCHERGADPDRDAEGTIFSMPELLPLIIAVMESGSTQR